MPPRLLAVTLTVAAATVAASQTVPTDVTVPTRVTLPEKNFSDAVTGTDAKWDMVYVPGGEFVMGSPAGEPGRKPDEGPHHKVKVRPFWLGKCEVTWDEFYSFWKDEGLIVGDKAESLPEEFKTIGPDALTRPTNTFVDELYDHGRDGFPALCMSHHAAMMYCQWLRWKTKKPYRLPTEAEWEYACRAGTSGPYGFDGGAEVLPEYAWFKANSPDDDHPDGTTHKVGTKKANAFGLFDMHGNVSEWVLDHYDAGFYEKFAKTELALGPVNRPTSKKWPHVVRGGSWADQPDRLRSAARRGSDKTWIKHDPQLPTSIWWLTKMDVIGFRVALPVEEYPDLVGLKPMVARQPD